MKEIDKQIADLKRDIEAFEGLGRVVSMVQDCARHPDARSKSDAIARYITDSTESLKGQLKGVVDYKWGGGQ